jgi:hypothetical protein
VINPPKLIMAPAGSFDTGGVQMLVRFGSHRTADRHGWFVVILVLAALAAVYVALGTVITIIGLPD